MEFAGQRGPADSASCGPFVPRTFPGGVVELCLDRTGEAGLPSPSAEAPGAVKVGPSGPSVASREAVALTVAGRRS
jgi:hypothetical protein